MANINLRNKGKDYRSRTLHANDVVRKFRLSRPEFLRSRMASLSKRHNFALNDQPSISPVDIIPPSVPANLTFDYVSGNIEADSDNSVDPTNPATSGIKGYRWYLNGVFQAEESISEYTYPNIPAGENYTLGVSAIDNAGNESALQTGVIDLTIPEAPNLSTTVGETTITATVDPVAEAYFFNWYLDDVLITTTDTNNANSETYTFTGLTLDQQYKVSAQVVKQYGILGEKAHVFATPVDVTPPNDITNLSLDNSQDLTLEASWTASISSDIDFYEVYLDGTLDGTTSGTTYTFSSLTKDQQYTVQIVSVDTSGNKSTGVTASEFARDRLAPAVPTGLTLVEALNTEVDISWDANTDPDIASYKVYVDSVQNQTVNHPTTTATITGLTDGTQYSIQISAVDDVGNESALSTAILATPQDTIAPQPVTNLATSPTGSDITMTWTDSTSTDVDYVSVLLDGAEQAQIAEGVQTYTFTGLTELTEYTVSAIVVDTSGNQSTEVSETVSTVSNIPDAPTNFAVEAPSSATWDAVTGVDGYNVYLKGRPDKYLMDFNGVDQYLDIGAESFAAEAGEFTVEFDFVSNSVDPAILFGVVSIANSYIMRIHINRNNNEATDAGKMSLQLRSADGTMRRYGFTNDEVINDGEIHHFAWTVNVNTFRCYLDGVEVPLTISSYSSGSKSLIGQTWNSVDTPYFFGADNSKGTAGNHADCMLTNMRLWSTERTPAEIDNNKRVYLDGTQTNLFAQYLLEEGSGDTTEDLAGTNNGTLTGNVSDNMWEVDARSASTDFVKQNDSLIATEAYSIEFLSDGDYETYVTSQKNTIESSPSNTVLFTVNPPSVVDTETANDGNLIGNYGENGVEYFRQRFSLGADYIGGGYLSRFGMYLAPEIGESVVNHYLYLCQNDTITVENVLYQSALLDISAGWHHVVIPDGVILQQDTTYFIAVGEDIGVASPSTSTNGGRVGTAADHAIHVGIAQYSLNNGASWASTGSAVAISLQ